MDFRVCESYETMSAEAAGVIAGCLREQPNLLLGVATGATPTQAYALLTARAREEPGLAREARLIAIDEWGGLPPGDESTCDAYVRTHVLEPLEVCDARYTRFSAETDDPERECRRVREWLVEHGPIDLCLLGLGTNGHLALVEPAPELQRGAHVATLSDASLGHTMLAGAASPPAFGLTLGIDELLASRRVLLLVSGAHKRPQLARLLNGPISTSFPASLLWLHGHTTVICDRDAAPAEPVEDTRQNG